MVDRSRRGNAVVYPVFAQGLASGVGNGTFTRSTSATMYDAATGYRVTKGVDEPRENAKDPVTGFIGLEFEPDRVNYAQQSDDVSGSSYEAKFYNTITTGDSLGADNTLSMALIQNNTGFGAPTIEQQFPAAIPDDSIVYASIDLAVSGSNDTWHRVQLRSRGNLNAFANFNLSGDGAVGQIDGGDVDALGASIVKLENGVYRIACGFDIGSGGTTPTCIIQSRLSDGGAASNPGDQTGGSDGLLANALQFEIGGYPSSYIENTGTSTASRARDDLTFPTPAGVDIANGTVAFDVVLKGEGTENFISEGGSFASAGAAGIFSATGFGKMLFDISNDPDNPGSFKHTDGSAGGHSMTSNTVGNANTIYKAVLAYQDTARADTFGKRAWFINGSDAWTTNSPSPGNGQGDSPPSWNQNPDNFSEQNIPATLEIGAPAEDFGAICNAGMFIRNVKIYSRVLADSEAKALSS